MKILIVENEKSLARMLHLTLQRAGHDILGPACTVGEALKIANEVSPDLALIDVYLDDDREGTELAQILDAPGYTTTIFTTADTEKAQSFSHYAFGLLQKPYPLSSIIPTVMLIEALREGQRYLAVPHALRLFRFPHPVFVSHSNQDQCEHQEAYDINERRVFIGIDNGQDNPADGIKKESRRKEQEEPVVRRLPEFKEEQADGQPRHNNCTE